jgi:hypothetical protein
LVQDDAQLAKLGEGRYVVARRAIVVCGRGIGKGLPVLKFFVLIEKLDRNMTICFLKYCCAALVQGLDLVDDYFVWSV